MIIRVSMPGRTEMIFACTISRSADGRWAIRHSGDIVGTVETMAASREEAVEKMRGELRYRLELCPCTGDSYQYIDVEITES